LTNGTSGEMFCPSLYINTWKSSDDLIRLGRAVEWHDLGGEIYAGEGTRIFSMDGKDRSILDIESIEFGHE
jgi:protein involved in temperature-dependent protein secretion